MVGRERGAELLTIGREEASEPVEAESPSDRTHITSRSEQASCAL